MTRSWPYLSGVLLACTLSGCTEKADFEPLFNGIDLSGWVNVNGAPDTWTVRDSMIVCTGVPTGVLRTTEHYENFILELEWRHLHEGGNAGLFVYSDPLPVRGQPFTRSVESQIMDGNHGDVFAIQGATMVPDRPHPQGWMRSLPTEERANPAGQWNHYRVESRDGRITLAVNGKVVSGGSQSVPRKGYICLESEGSEVHFRNIRIKPLPPSNPLPNQIAGFDQGFTSLYTGVDLSGWKTTRRHLEHWRANDWRLAYDGAPSSNGLHLWTEKNYRDFTLIVDWRFTGDVTTQTLPALNPDGTYRLDEKGNRLLTERPSAGESGIFIRGFEDYPIDIWNWPIGSGGMLNPTNTRDMPLGVRPGLTPSKNMDQDIGEWNRFIITVTGLRLTVVANNERIIDSARLPHIPNEGPIGLAARGAPIEFANLYIKELPSGR